MAEGDSIARLAARLHAATAGRTVVGGTFRHPRLALADLSGQRIEAWLPRGKHLLMRTSAGLTLHSHLRMSGSWSVLGPGKRLPRSVEARVLLRLDDGRTLAGVALPVLDLVRTRDEARVVGHLGPDLLSADFDADGAARRLHAGPDTAAVAALLDQRRVAGLGNMWAGELCFLHRVDPWGPIGEVDVGPLLDDARARLREAVATNPRQITTGDPRRPHWVYGRARRPCYRCGTPVAFRPAARTPHGRETWWCPGCQR